MSRELIEIDLAAAMELIELCRAPLPDPDKALGLIRRAKHRLTAAEYGILIEADASMLTHLLVSESE